MSATPSNADAFSTIVGCSRSANPERAEVHRRIAGAPALDEALHRRVEHDVIELVEREEAHAADRCILALEVLERAVGEIDAEDDVDDMAVSRTPVGRDRLRDRDRPLEDE